MRLDFLARLLTVLLPAIALAQTVAAASPPPPSSASPPASLPCSAPPALDDGWPTACPGAVGLDASALAEMEAAFGRKELAAPDSILVAREGKLVYERYAPGWDAAKPHDLRSATKSITSLLVGVALERKLLPSPSLPVFPALPEGKGALAAEPRLGEITLEHLLTMSSGLDCDDWDPKSPGQEDRMYRSRDWVRFVLALPRRLAPGVERRYCTGGVELLGALLTRSAGKPVPAFAEEALFGPLGFGPLGARAWQPTPEGGTDTGGHLKLRPRDFAKIGQLVLDQGSWRGKPLVPAAWIAESTRGRGRLGDSEYGYLWWVNTFTVQGTPVPVVFARGNGGQYLFVAPSLRLVAAFNGSRYNRPEGDQAVAIFGRFVLRAALAPLLASPPSQPDPAGRG